MAINETQVIEAAETLVNQGKIPTIELVRRLLGDTGSHSTISKYLRVWRETQVEIVSATSAAITKSVTPEPVNRAVDQVWQALQAKSDQAIQAIKEEYAQKQTAFDQQMQMAQQEATDAKATVDAMEQQYDALQLQYMKLDKAHQDLQGEQKQLQTQLTQQQADFHVLQRETEQFRVTQLQQHERSVATLQASHAQALTGLQQVLDASLEQQEHQRHESMAEIDRLQAVNKQLTVKFAEQSTLNTALMEKIKALETEKNAWQSQCDNCHTQQKSQESTLLAMAATQQACLDALETLQRAVQTEQ